MSKKQHLNDEEGQVLADAISKLSEEDQMQIAGAGEINDKQCEELKRYFQNHPGLLMATGYAAPIPTPIRDDVLLRWKRIQEEKRN